MNAARRIDGIDLFRGIAAFAVVILHSDEVIKVSPQGWAFFLNFSAFAVPFFLATSFYLLVDKIGNSSQLIKWPDRFSRLLTPYVFWSAVYLGIKILQFFLKKQPHKIQVLLEKWPELIFLGQSAFHLYFIPLLISGILLIISVESFLRSRPGLLSSICLLFIFIFIYSFYLSFDFANVRWLEEIMKVKVIGLDPIILGFFIKILGFFLRCSSYIAAALICSRLMFKDRLLDLKFPGFLVCLILFIAVNLNAFSDFGLPKAVEELLKGYITLALAFTSSIYIQNNSIISSLGRCSFGIYLMHLVFLQILWSVANKIRFDFEKPSLMILIFSVIFVYLMSWLLTYFLMKKKEISKIMFGA
jgi:peptidoglycan/LPS O-acetylase OafA/YrhL